MPTFTLRKAPPSRIPSVTVTAPDLDSALREARFLDPATETFTPVESVIFTDEDGRPRFVPMWAPARIFTLATMKRGARLVFGVPESSTPWHPEVDG